MIPLLICYPSIWVHWGEHVHAWRMTAVQCTDVIKCSSSCRQAQIVLLWLGVTEKPWLWERCLYLSCLSKRWGLGRRRTNTKITNSRTSSKCEKETFSFAIPRFVRKALCSLVLSLVGKPSVWCLPAFSAVLIICWVFFCSCRFGEKEPVGHPMSTGSSKSQVSRDSLSPQRLRTSIIYHWEDWHKHLSPQ